MSVTKQQISGIDTIHIAGAEKGPAIIMLHGYGASFEDLFPLAQYVDTPPGTHWYFPNGPVEVPVGLAEPGRAWFHINIERLTMLSMQADVEAIANLEYDGIDEMAEKMKSYLETIQAKHSKVILAGFSQGSMLSLHLCLKYGMKPAGLGLLSSTLAHKKTWSAQMPNIKDIAVFQSHGQDDPVLPFFMAEALRDVLKNSGISLEFHPFQGMHEIPMPILEKFGQFCRDNLK